jgi:hypothetical protein
MVRLAESNDVVIVHAVVILGKFHAMDSVCLAVLLDMGEDLAGELSASDL